MTQPAIDREHEPGVVTTLTYTLKRPEKLVYRITDMGEDEDDPAYHAWYEKHDVTVRDARAGAFVPTLDREGFELHRAPTAVADFYSDGFDRETYDREIGDLLARITGASRVLVFDHTIRIASDALRRSKKVREIVDLVHNDYTVDSGPQRVRNLLPADEAAVHLGHRFAVYNVWRSIASPVEMTPLAVCDSASVADADWVACGLDYGDRMGEIYNVAYNPDHRWYYYPSMDGDEVLVFKNFDSAADGRARFTPHTAFKDPTARPDARPRESIETRVLVFFDP